MKPWKKSTIFFTIAAIMAITVFTFAACDNNGGNGVGDIDLPGTITIKPDGSTTVGTVLTATYSGMETVAYQWKRGSANVGANSTQYTPDQEGSYTVTVSANGYKSKTSDVVTVTEASGTGNNDDSGGSNGDGSGSEAEPLSS